MKEVIKKTPILLPKVDDMSKWAVVACDQFCAQPEYWEELAEYVGDAPSTLNLIFPEIYLSGDVDSRVNEIDRCMNEYLKDGIFYTVDGFVLTVRTVKGGGKRLGLVLAVDLESYDYRRVRTEIRATEDTIKSRLPIRMRIRKNASIELPHILLLVDDRKKEIIEPLYRDRDKLTKLYDFDLNMDGGHIAGYAVTDVQPIIDKFNALLNPDEQIAKYGVDAGIMLAVGDGNHSMATAKECWNEIKKGLTEEEQKDHPARYALVEIVNIYDDEMTFEPINRLVTGAGKDFMDKLHETVKSIPATGNNCFFTVFDKDSKEVFSVPTGAGETIKALQEFLEKYKADNNGFEIEYVHGDEHTAKTVAENDGIGILMPAFKKEDLIKYVVNVGNLPKKAFSIGTAEDKKYYVEAKRIK